MLERAIAEYSAAMDIADRDARRQRFAVSEQLFRQATESLWAAGRPATAELWVSLGNAALQADHLGQAIVAYRRALRRAPFHARAAQNLEFARAALPPAYRSNSTNPWWRRGEAWRAIGVGRTASLVVAAIFLVGGLSLAVGVTRRGALWRRLGVVMLILWCVAMLAMKYGERLPERGAVITASEVMLRSADSENAATSPLEPLPEGTEVTILDERGDWVEIQIAGQNGWVRTRELTRVAGA